MDPGWYSSLQAALYSNKRRVHHASDVSFPRSALFCRQCQQAIPSTERKVSAKKNVSHRNSPSLVYKNTLFIAVQETLESLMMKQESVW